jgi:hypothetical protein
MTMIGWPNVSPSSTPLGIFCRSIELSIHVGDFLAITIGENSRTDSRSSF